MEDEFNDTQLLIQKTLRDYFTREIEPLVPDMEDGKLLCYEPIRKMMRELGLGEPDGELASVLADSSPEDRLAQFLPRILPIELARVCGGLTLSWGASIGLAGGAIDARGTAEQKRRWGAPIKRFDLIASWCLTEPGAGSAAIRDMKTRALPDGEDFVLNGSKTFITNAPYADVFVVYAKLQPEGRPESVQPFIVERGDPGVTTGSPFKKMGFRSSPTGEVFLQDCRIPADRLLGGGVRDRDHVKSSLANERLGLQPASGRRADRQLPADPATARAHVHRPPQFANDRVERSACGSRPARQCRGHLRGQALHRRDGQLGHARSHPHSRRQRLHGGVRGRTSRA